MPVKRAWLLSVLIVASSARGLSALTLSEIETQVRRHVRDTASSSSLQRYSDTVLDGYINEAQREIVNIAWPLHTETSFTLVAQTTFYSLPDDLIAPKAVYYTNASGATYELEEKLYQAYRQNNPDYERQRGPPALYTVRNSTWGANNLEVAFIPVATSASTGTVRMEYYNQATDLSDDADVPFDGYLHLYPYHDALTYNAVSRIKLIEGDTVASTAYFQLYKDLVNRMLSRLGQSPNYNPSISAGPSR